MNTPRVVIVGGGLLGASVAHALAVRAVPVTLLDAAAPGTGASASTFAWANAQKKKPEAYFRLNAEGLAEYHRLAETAAGRRWFHPVGNVEIATDAASSAALDAVVADLTERGYRAERITGRQAAGLDPVIDPDRVLDAAWFPDEGWVDTERMVADLLDDAVAVGAEVRAHCPVARFEQSGARTKVVLADGEEILADQVVCAAGAATGRLLADSGVTVPLVEEGDRRLRAPGDERYTAVGGLADTAALRVPLRRILHTPDMGLRPAPGGRVVLGGDGAGSRVPRTDHGIFGLGPMLIDRARKVFPAFADVPVERVRVGVRPLPADGLTVAGFTEPLPGLYALVTHSGVTLAPYLAWLVTGELLDGREAPELAAFRPTRFAGPGHR
ncbi:NAD(P)/FAD-dependent oxidoreductase [Streptomyces camelliae]|uniref:FAD-binding oxidoreductase n=1 Tax=Streptomyces camelliae TaxID=3004093 RepID=A0ABY7P5D7_9ACTN|nr:FAD-binding oxidoreductase [Streptomyces sp. HUAS 2-6]WBO64744.1 FAD-binding oxidoreductase [Streptomyces sp. HUAS 2-6]